jgi:hypothetical protein
VPIRRPGSATGVAAGSGAPIVVGTPEANSAEVTDAIEGKLNEPDGKPTLDRVDVRPPMNELMSAGRPDGKDPEGRPPMTDNNELTPPGTLVGFAGTLNPEGSMLDGRLPITESMELRSAGRFVGDAEPAGTLTPDGRTPDGTMPDGRLLITDSRELS